MTVEITTASGAVYILTGSRITGGSKNLQDGTILYMPNVGDSMLIFAPERGHLNPRFKNPSVLSTPVVDIVPVREGCSCHL